MNDLVISRLDSARAALAEAKTISATKQIYDLAVAAQIYARRQGLSEEIIDYAHAIKVEALVQLGNMLKATQRNGGTRLTGGGTFSGPPQDLPTLADLGLEKHLSSLAQRVAGFSPEKLSDLIARKINLTARDTIALKWAGDEQSYTPEKYIASARTVMRSIDLDPASDDYGQITVQAQHFFSLTDDGLSKDWSGNVFLNPPYTFPIIAKFIDKLLDYIEDGAVPQAILLTNNNTDTAWWHTAATRASAICFTRGRINFLKIDGRLSQPTNGQTFFYFGDAHIKFKTEFSQHGWVVLTS